MKIGLKATVSLWLSVCLLGLYTSTLAIDTAQQKEALVTRRNPIGTTALPTNNNPSGDTAAIITLSVMSAITLIYLTHYFVKRHKEKKHHAEAPKLPSGSYELDLDETDEALGVDNSLTANIDDNPSSSAPKKKPSPCPMQACTAKYALPQILNSYKVKNVKITELHFDKKTKKYRKGLTVNVNADPKKRGDLSNPLSSTDFGKVADDMIGQAKSNMEYLVNEGKKYGKGMYVERSDCNVKSKLRCECYLTHKKRLPDKVRQYVMNFPQEPIIDPKTKSKRYYAIKVFIEYKAIVYQEFGQCKSWEWIRKNAKKSYYDYSKEKVPTKE